MGFLKKINGIILLGLFFSFFITSLSIFLNAIAWKFLLSWLEIYSPKISFIPLFIKTNILKYIQGGVWHLAERLVLLKAEIPLNKSILAVFLEPFLMLAAAFVLIAFGKFAFPFRALCFLPALLFHIKFRSLLLKFVERFILRKMELINTNYAFEAYAFDSSFGIRIFPSRAFFMEIFFILFRFLGFWICLNSFSISDTLILFDWISIFSLAWVLGLIIPGAPGGVGIFESIILLAVSDSVSSVPLLCTLLSYRLISTFSDVTTYLIIRFTPIAIPLVKK